MVGDGAYEFPIVGESHYQSSIEAIAGKKTERGVRHRCAAALIPEPTNRYDPNAVKVQIDGATVGYLSRDTAKALLKTLAEDGFSAAVANAVIVGGWDRGGDDVGSFGVKLNAVSPFSFQGQAERPNIPIKEEALEPPNKAAMALISIPPEKKKRKWLRALIVIIALVVLYNLFSGNSKGERIVAVLNSQFSTICDAKLEGLFSDTLRLDWTASTRKLDSITVMAAIGGAKSNIYDSGIRYLKFPNDAGGYNVIDWKTGEKSSVNEKSKYYFP